MYSSISSLDFAPVQIRFSQLSLSQHVFPTCFGGWAPVTPACCFSYAPARNLTFAFKVSNSWHNSHFSFYNFLRSCVATSWVANRAAPELVIDFLHPMPVQDQGRCSLEECTVVILECFGAWLGVFQSAPREVFWLPCKICLSLKSILWE